MHDGTATIELALRGRGIRSFARDIDLLVSKAGSASPLLMRVTDVEVGDWVGVHYGGEWGTQPARLPCPVDRPLRGSEKAIRVPTEMTTELALLLGAYFSEGHTIRSNWSVILTNSVMEVLERAQRAWCDVFELHARITRQPGRCTGLVVSSKRLVEYLDMLGCGTRAANKKVPACIAEGTRHHALAFLQGAALDAYTTTATSAKWAICLESAQGITGLQDVITRLGIPNAQIPKVNRQMAKTYYELYAPGRSGQELSRLIPFLEPHKAMRALEYQQRAIVADHDHSDVIPGVVGPELYALVPPGRGGRNGGAGRQRLRHLCDARTTRVTRGSVLRARDAGAVLPTWLDALVRAPYRFVPVLGGTPAPE